MRLSKSLTQKQPHYGIMENSALARFVKLRGKPSIVEFNFIIVIRNRQSGNMGRLNTNLYLMLKFTERLKTPGMASKKNIAFPEGNKLFAGDFVLIWMKQTLIWFNLQRDGTRNGLSNIKKTFAESLQLQMSVLHQHTSIFQSSMLVSHKFS